MNIRNITMHQCTMMTVCDNDFNYTITVQNDDSHVLNFNSNINKDKKHLMNNVNPFISCFLVNAHSIINKMDELESYVYALKPDLIMITDYWARDEISNTVLGIDYFAINCNDGKIFVGGGCNLYLFVAF